MSRSAINKRDINATIIYPLFLIARLVMFFLNSKSRICVGIKFVLSEWHDVIAAGPHGILIDLTTCDLVSQW